MCLRAVLTWLSCPWYQDSISLSLSLSASLSLSLPLLSFSPTIIKTHQLVKGNLKSNLKKCFYSYAFSFLACLFDLVLFLFRKRRRITQKFPSQRPLQVLGWFLFLFLKKRVKQIAAGARVFTSTACPDLFRELVPHSGQILRPLLQEAPGVTLPGMHSFFPDQRTQNSRGTASQMQGFSLFYYLLLLLASALR